MEIIVIEGKDYKRSKRVAEEISWTHLQVKAAKKLAERIEDLQDEMDNIIRWYCDSFPEAQQSSVRYEILEYLKPTKDGESLSRRISRTEKLCEQMEERLLKNLHQESE